MEDKKLRIVFVTPEFVTEKSFDGGLANYVDKISRALSVLGHNPVVMVASGEERVFKHGAVEVHAVNVYPTILFLLKVLNKLTCSTFDFFHPWFLQSFLLNRYVAKYCLDINVDVIQYASYTATSLFRLAHPKSIARISGYQKYWEVAYGLDENSRAARQIERIEDLAFSKVDVVFGPSALIARVVEKVIGKSVRVIRSPQELPILDDMEARCESIRPYCIFFGSMGRLKGVDLIANILPNIFKQYHHVDFYFVGKDMPFQGGVMSDYVLSMAGDDAHRVKFLGKLTHERLLPLLKNSAAVVLPSRVDNYPNACLEAMSAGAVVIGSDGASFEEIITPYHDGILFPVGNEAGLLAAVQYALDMDDESRERMAANAVATAASKSDPAECVKQHIQLYKSVVNSENS